MGLFRKAGRKAERFRQQVKGAAEDEVVAECPECATSVYTEREDCPECGAALAEE